MLDPHIIGGSPVICCIIAHNRRASSRRCPSGTPARKPSTDAPVRRIAGPFLAAMPSCSHSRVDLPRRVTERRGGRRGEPVALVQGEGDGAEGGVPGAQRPEDQFWWLVGRDVAAQRG